MALVIETYGLYIAPLKQKRAQLEVDLYTLLQKNPVLLTFVVIGFGYLLGNVTIAGIQVGSTTGVLIAGLIGDISVFRTSLRPHSSA